MTNETKYDSCERIKLTTGNTMQSELKIIDLANDPFRYNLWISRRKKMNEDRTRLMTAGIY